MKRLIKAATDNQLTEEELLSLLDDAEEIMMQACQDRNQGEYVDDVKWGKDRFEIPIFISPSPRKTEQVASFKWVFDPDDEDYDASEQVHLKLDEFLQEWNTDDEEDYTSDDYISHAIEDVTSETYGDYKVKGCSSIDDIADLIIARLADHPYYLEFGEDFYKDDVLVEMDDYFWQVD